MLYNNKLLSYLLDMAIVNLDDHIVSLDKILNKKIKNITFKEAISLFFHTATVMINNSDPEYEQWKELYIEFEGQVVQQNKLIWPQLTITKNDYGKRIDIIAMDKSFVPSKNIFTLLLRLLYIENYKRAYVFKSYEYHKILSHKLKNESETLAKSVSLDEIFSLLKKHVIRFLKIYTNDKYYEHLLGKKIFNYFEN